MVMVPLVYMLAINYYKDEFKKEENRTRTPLKTRAELAALALAEAAVARQWVVLGRPTVFDMEFILITVFIAAMMVLCFTDLWEKIVPNKFLIAMTLICVAVNGLMAVGNMQLFVSRLPSIVFGVGFCLICFGLVYIVGRGSMGAGDFKLSLVMGLYLTGQYIAGAVLAGCICSAVYSLIMLISKKMSKKDTIPFVPFLFLGTIITLIAG